MEYWKKQRLKEIMKHIIVVVLIIAAFIGIIFGIKKYYDQFYLKTEVRTVEVINKEDNVYRSVVLSGKVLIPVTTHSYYLYGVNNEKVSVSSYTYNTVKKGDKIQVECTYVYYKKDNSLHKIEYKYLEE